MVYGLKGQLEGGAAYMSDIQESSSGVPRDSFSVFDLFPCCVEDIEFVTGL